MFTDSELTQFVKVCTTISSEVADGSGFVPVRNLLTRFHAKLSVRPLLVEGMLVSNNKTMAEGGDSYRWTVLLDSERYLVDASDLEQESWGKPLPSRLRYTVAHELVHSLAFNPSQFGVRLTKSLSGEKGMKQLVENIEQSTDYLSPLLLWSNDAITKFFGGLHSSASATDLAELRKKIGVSRFVLISRLHLFKKINKYELERQEGLRNLAIGLGRWVNARAAVLSKRPLFINFENGIIPQMIRKTAREDNLQLSSLIKNEDFGLREGRDLVLNLDTEAALDDGSASRVMRVEFAMEGSERKPGSTFLYTVRKI